MNAWLFIIILTDLVIIVAIVVLLFKLNNHFRNNIRQLQGYREELRHLSDESEKAATGFFADMRQTTAGLLEILKSLEEKQRNLEKLLRNLPGGITGESEVQNHGSKYDNLIQLVRQGLPEEIIRKQSGLAEAEIDLILQLYRKKEDLPRPLMDGE